MNSERPPFVRPSLPILRGRVAQSIAAFEESSSSGSRRPQGALERRQSSRLVSRQASAPYLPRRSSTEASERPGPSTGVTDLLSEAVITQPLTWDEEATDAAETMATEAGSCAAIAAGAPPSRRRSSAAREGAAAGARGDGSAPMQAAVTDEREGGPPPAQDGWEGAAEPDARAGPPAAASSSRAGAPSFPPPPTDRRLTPRHPTASSARPTINGLASGFPQPPSGPPPGMPIAHASFRRAPRKPPKGGTKSHGRSRRVISSHPKR